MKRFLACFFVAIIVMPVTALDLGQGFTIGGGVKSGLLIKNSDFTGKLGNLPHGSKQPMTLYFASQDNEAYNGEGWMDMGYAAADWGLKVSFWAHGNLTNFDETVHLGDHYLWANLMDERIRFIGGQGGGTPISTGGWLNAEWLGYKGLRLFWVDPLGFSLGINFPSPDDGPVAEGIKPVTYLSMIMFGAGYRYNDFWVSLVFNNTPIYDDSSSNYDGGLHRDPDANPIAQSGNIGFGVGKDKIFGGKGILAFDGMVTNLGEDDVVSVGSKSYKISPVKTTLALKGGYPVTEAFYAELKAKYLISQGDNGDRTASASWGKFELEPYASYQLIDSVKIELAVNYAAYINSYYLAVNYPADTAGNIPSLNAGQVGPYPAAFDYYSAWQLAIKPAFVYSWSGCKVIVGYNGSVSRDHVENTMFVDFRWSF